jgi:betaine lipid synthase
VRASSIMGAGGDGGPARDSVMAKGSSDSNGAGSIGSRIGLPSMETLKNDLTVLRHLWFSKASGGDHASRLESFYGPQAEACEFQDGAAVRRDAVGQPAVPKLPSSPIGPRSLLCAVDPILNRLACCADDAFRTNFLWGRKPLLAACAARLRDLKNITWVDLGGGTGVRHACMRIGGVLAEPSARSGTGLAC